VPGEETGESSNSRIPSWLDETAQGSPREGTSAQNAPDDGTSSGHASEDEQDESSNHGNASASSATTVRSDSEATIIGNPTASREVEQNDPRTRMPSLALPSTLPPASPY
jgi:hypothetical protein